MSADLEGKVILVTGAGSGIGEACATFDQPTQSALPGGGRAEGVVDA